MAKLTIDIDVHACAEIMRRYELVSQSEAVNFALRVLVDEKLYLVEAKLLRVSGWGGDLTTMRESKKAIVEHLLDIPDVGEDDDFVRK